MDEIIADNLSGIADTDARIVHTRAMVAEVQSWIRHSREALNGSYALLRGRRR